MMTTEDMLNYAKTLKTLAEAKEHITSESTRSTINHTIDQIAVTLKSMTEVSYE